MRIEVKVNSETGILNRVLFSCQSIQMKEEHVLCYSLFIRGLCKL